jgi:hypothetical protein
MAIDYELCFATQLTVGECRKLLLERTDLVVSTERPDIWLVNDVSLVVTRPVRAEDPGSSLCKDLFGFRPTLQIGIRPALSMKTYDPAMRSMLQVINVMFNATTGDAGFAFEFERAVLQRVGGTVYLRDDYKETSFIANYLALLSFPYQLKKMTP